jgi:hypothetical protein
LAAPYQKPQEQARPASANKPTAADHQTQAKITASKARYQGNYIPSKPTNQPTSNITQKAKEKPIRKANRAIKSKRKPPDNPSPEGKDIITKDIRRKDRKYPTSSGTDGCNSATFNLKKYSFSWSNYGLLLLSLNYWINCTAQQKL